MITPSRSGPKQRSLSSSLSFDLRNLYDDQRGTIAVMTGLCASSSCRLYCARYRRRIVAGCAAVDAGRKPTRPLIPPRSPIATAAEPATLPRQRESRHRKDLSTAKIRRDGRCRTSRQHRAVTPATQRQSEVVIQRAASREVILKAFSCRAIPWSAPAPSPPRYRALPAMLSLSATASQAVEFNSKFFEVSTRLHAMSYPIRTPLTRSTWSGAARSRCPAWLPWVVSR